MFRYFFIILYTIAIIFLIYRIIMVVRTGVNKNFQIRGSQLILFYLLLILSLVSVIARHLDKISTN